jgi:hypothetical protein
MTAFREGFYPCREVRDAGANLMGHLWFHGEANSEYAPPN